MRGFDASLPMALLRAREAAMAFFRPTLNAHGLTEQQWRVIRILHAGPDPEFHELAKRSCILPPSLTGILTRLERDGLVRRRKLPGDQRRLSVALTAKGRARVGQVSAAIEDGYRQIEDQLGTRRLEALFALLNDAAQLVPPAGAAAPEEAAD